MATVRPGRPAEEGTGHDLAIAIAILVASGQLDGDRLPGTALIGELALDGGLMAAAGPGGALVSHAGTGTPTLILLLPDVL